MKTKKEIVDNWLPRYTGKNLENFGKYILLTNFQNYVQLFEEETEKILSNGKVKKEKTSDK